MIPLGGYLLSIFTRNGARGIENRIRNCFCRIRLDMFVISYKGLRETGWSLPDFRLPWVQLIGYENTPLRKAVSIAYLIGIWEISLILLDNAKNWKNAILPRSWFNSKKTDRKKIRELSLHDQSQMYLNIMLSRNSTIINQNERNWFITNWFIVLIIRIQLSPHVLKRREIPHRRNNVIRGKWNLKYFPVYSSISWFGVSNYFISSYYIICSVRFPCCNRRNQVNLRRMTSRKAFNLVKFRYWIFAQ